VRGRRYLLRQALLHHPPVLNHDRSIGEDGGVDRVMSHQKCRARVAASADISDTTRKPESIQLRTVPSDTPSSEAA
jgi:hypothetical protein